MLHPKCCISPRPRPALLLTTSLVGVDRVPPLTSHAWPQSERLSASLHCCKCDFDVLRFAEARWPVHLPVRGTRCLAAFLSCNQRIGVTAVLPQPPAPPGPLVMALCEWLASLALALGPWLVQGGRRGVFLLPQFRAQHCEAPHEARRRSDLCRLLLPGPSWRRVGRPIVVGSLSVHSSVPGKVMLAGATVGSAFNFGGRGVPAAHYTQPPKMVAVCMRANSANAIVDR